MLWNLGFIWLAIALATVVILSFLLGLCLDAIMGPDGFGAVGNTVVLAGGFFVTLTLFNQYGHSFANLSLATVYGVGGAFTAVSVVAVLKALGARLRL